MPELLILLAACAAAVMIFRQDGLLDAWRSRRGRARRMQRQDVLKQVLLNNLEGQPSAIGGLAKRLNTTEAKLTPVIKHLASAGHLAETADGLRLTPLGRGEAIGVVRAHRLWERHLADDTGFAETEWHAMAERQEHLLSPAELEALAHRLGQPARDPHGDPIPTATGEVVLHEGRPLTGLPVGSTVRITHVEDEPADVYDQITAVGLVPGSIIRLVEIGPGGAVLAANGDEHRLPAAAARLIAAVPVETAALPQDYGGRPLHVLRVGERGRVLGLSPRCHGAERRRMLDLGILPGTTIEAVLRSPSGDPTAYRIRDALIALRREQADLVRVARTAEQTR
jgi:DtxR family Mn-dependent transcriptional regulator